MRWESFRQEWKRVYSLENYITCWVAPNNQGLEDYFCHSIFRVPCHFSGVWSLYLNSKQLEVFIGKGLVLEGLNDSKRKKTFTTFQDERYWNEIMTSIPNLLAKMWKPLEAAQVVEPGPWVPLNWGCERLVLAWSLGLVLELMTSSHVVIELQNWDECV